MHNDKPDAARDAPPPERLGFMILKRTDKRRAKQRKQERRIATLKRERGW